MPTRPSPRRTPENLSFTRLVAKDVPPPDSPQSRGLRAHLHHLLPRHALFHAHIEIHQLSSVPLVRGEFAVRWKLKHCVAPPGAKQSLLKHRNTSAGVGGMNRSQLDLTMSARGKDEQTDADTVSMASSLSRGNTSSHDSSHDDPIAFGNVPTVVVSEDSSSSSTSSIPRQTPSRGQTSFLHLREHSVSWSQTLSVHLKIPLSRDRDNPDLLMPSPAKFVIMQRVVQGDPDAPRNPRLGAVYLDLSEYAGPTVGEVTRRYLLRDSKTNATLKMTIQLTHVGGEKHFLAPPLPKGEILTGLTGLLENDIYNTRPSGFDMFGHFIDEEGFQEDSDDSDSEGRSHSTHSQANSRASSVRTEPLDVRRLPLDYAYGPRTTETLIEALFNPVQLPRSLQPEGKLNPFIEYVPDHELMGARS